MSVVPFPQSGLARPLSRLLDEIEAVLERVAAQGELSPLEIVGALEWAKMNVFYGASDE